ncbi:D-cysteine desulfhydrase 2 mitochondrial [Bienertia sinuspersici]
MLFIKMLHNMKLHHWPKSSVFAARRNEFLSRNLVYNSQDASQLKFSLEESISKLLDRRWTLEIPDTKVHQITLSVKQTSTKSGIFGNVNFSMDAYPKLGDAMMDERCKDPSFYIIRDDLLHPFVNGNKARKLDALLPIIEDCSGTDVVTCGGCQSAHATAVAVSCAERGLRSHLLLRGEQPEILTGYNLVSSMYGNVTYIPRSIYTKREEMLLGQANAIAGNTGSVVWFTDILDSLSDLPSGRNCIRTNAYTSLEDGMKKVVIIKEGAGDAVALLGIIRLVRYLSQSHILGKDRPYNFVIDSGTGTTAIGFALGALILNLPWKVTAVMLADTLDGYKNQENRLISDFKRYAASHLRNYTLKNDLVHWVNRRTPRKFGNVMEGEIKACQQVANQTGVLVDPIYTLSAWELAVNLSQEQLDKEAKVVMLHTGGTLGMFGLAQRYKSYFNTLKDGPPQ